MRIVSTSLYRYPTSFRGCHRACRAVEQMKGVRGDVDEAIRAQLGRCLTSTSLKGYGEPTVGKVRDIYDAGKHLIIITTDRQSAFDRVLASIPFKGQVLNQTSAWWLQKTESIIPNALEATPDPCVSVMRKCQVFPVEFVVRGYMTGSTETSLWTHYKSGARSYCGNNFPDGMVKNQKLEANVITPTTKSATRDVPISADDILKQGLMCEDDWKVTSEAALALFAAGQEEALKRDLLLVDTKYEFGKDENGNIFLVDEIHTPDSSRYWLANSYSDRFNSGQEPDNIDKEFLRLWFRDNCDPYKDKELPSAPEELVIELSRRYIYLYEQITGKVFDVPCTATRIDDRIQANLDCWRNSSC